MKLSVFTGTLTTRYGWKKALSMIRDAGFDALDFTIDDWCNLDGIKNSPNLQMSLDEIRAYYGEIRAYADKVGLTVGQTHAAFGPVEIQTAPEYRELLERSIMITSLLGCPYIVIHPFRTPGRLFDAEYDEVFAMNLDLFRSLMPSLKKYGVKLGIEPMWSFTDGRIVPSVCSRPEEILRYIDILGDECFCSCFDFGHVALTGADTGDTVDGAIRKLGDKMKLVHIHEVDGIHDNHTAPYTFKFDWEPILRAMKETGYSGTFNFEVGGNYFSPYPDALIPEALRHLAAIGRYMISEVEG